MMSENPDKQVDEAPISPAAPGESEPGEDFSAPATSPTESAEQIIRTLRDQNRQLTDQLLRNKAEMDNARKRLAREKEEFQQFSIFQTLQALLPILDGFELALAAEGGGEDYRKGVEIIYLQFLGTMQRLGLEPIEAKGKPFDPNVHEAIATVETTAVPEQHVVDELQRGFFFKNRLLRPAKVRVANPPATDELTVNHDA
ncbi:MAG: nucleotide exchange factor GrpE [Acidobacteria bacterium]|nr:nucleotide exchange factor GrpE [Acidobacteriota bacterium]